MVVNDGRVTCGACRHFTPNRHGAGGVGTCGIDYVEHTKSLTVGRQGYAPYPNAERYCDRFIERRKAVTED